MTLKTDTFPLVAYPVDNAWAVFRDYETEALVYITALTAGATCQVASGAIFGDPSQLGSPTTLTFPQAGVTQTVSLPVGGVSSVNRVHRVLPTAGRFTVSFVGPSQFTSYMSAPNAVNFSL